MQEIEVFLTPQGITDKDVRDRAVVVIDVFRACSTIATALANGARQVLPVPDMGTGVQLARTMADDTYLLGGERNGVMIEGCDLGNSPLDYTRDMVADRTVIFKTTNGTGAILAGQAGVHLVIGSLLNADRVVAFLESVDVPITLLCSGWRGRVSYEDTLCAGLFLDRLWQDRRPSKATDAARVAHALYLDARDDLPGKLDVSEHAYRLDALGHAADVGYCAQVGVLDVLPIYEENHLRLAAPAGENNASDAA